MGDRITISACEYEALKADVFWLKCLEAAGVDNWEGCDTALDIKEKRQERDRQEKQQFIQQLVSRQREAENES